jgi:predicted AlkP superfamily pyrophosphatase or phosphodiesterase
MKPFGLALVLLSSFSIAQAANPKLGVVLIIDQLSAQDFKARLPKTQFGFKRLTENGFVFDDCRYEAVPTITSVGHATLATGAYGAMHGIVGNEWFDREWNANRLSTEDKNYVVLGRDAMRDGTAPTAMRIPTLSEMVKLGHPQAKAVVISGKDRAAILTAGKASMAIWFDAEKPFFTTSTFYAKEIPAWVKPTNDLIAQNILKGAFTWALPAGGITGKSPVLPPLKKDVKDGKPATRQSDSEPFAERMEIQSSIDTAQIELALAAIKALEMGKDDVPDLLTISFSGHDRIGHQVGPEAKEALENFAHLDKEIDRLLKALDAQVGAGNYVVSLTADHGVAPMPEVINARGGAAGRVDVKAYKEVLEAELDKAYGANDYIVYSKSPGLSLSAHARTLLPKIFDTIRASAKKLPGVEDVLLASALNQYGELGQIYAKGYVEGRTPDVILILKPFFIYGTGDGTAHGSHYLYDRAVPLVFFGAGVPKGNAGYAEAIDMAPTMARLLHVPPPSGATGHALEILFSTKEVK